MRTLTGSLMALQKKLDWFSSLSEEERDRLSEIYFGGSNKGLLNEDVAFIHDTEKQAQDKAFDILAQVDLKFMYTKYKPYKGTIKKLALITINEMNETIDNLHTLDSTEQLDKARKFWLRVKHYIQIN